MKSHVPRIAPYPIMAPGCLDYTDGNAYESKQVNDSTTPSDAIAVLHRIKGSNLVSQLLLEKRAQFCCTIVSPHCAYRRVKKATATPIQTDEGIELQQTIQVVTDEFAYPVVFQPAVITNAPVAPFAAHKSHGLDSLWVGKRVELPIAAQIAIEPFWNAKTEFQSILRLRRVSDGSLRPGSFEVKESTEQGFYFLVEVEEGLFNGLRNPISFEHRNSIYTQALAQGLQILHDKFNDKETWTEFQNLRLLFQMLKSRNVPTCDDEDFTPNQAAAAFHPHVVKVAQEYEPE